VDLFVRPEVPGDRRTRGGVGLAGARSRIAMEAWLVNGHRQWAIFAVPPSDINWLKKAHIKEGVWPLDRIIRLPLVWNADGSPVELKQTAPKGRLAHGGGINVVLQGTRGRCGLQYFNGSNGHMRGTMGGPGYLKWARENPNVKAADVDVSEKMVGWAMMAYMAMDESAYPGRRAMLPWTHPEALNPFYQGMENMNFNADRYRVVSLLGAGLAALNHPEGKKILAHGQEQMDMALDRYVYPASGCWEESHGYCAHTMKNLLPLAEVLKETGLRDFHEDIRFARMFHFWCLAHSPCDPGFGGKRFAPPVGDHGLSLGGFARHFQQALPRFARARNPEIRKIARQMAWLLEELGAGLPESVNVKQEKPELRSRYLQGYGSTMRATGRMRHTATITLKGALWRTDRNKKPFSTDLTIRVPVVDGAWARELTGSAPRYNTGSHSGTLVVEQKGSSLRLRANVTIGDDRWVKGGQGQFTIELTKRGDALTGAFKGTYNGKEVSGTAAGALVETPEESYLVLRAGQSWGHHHCDKGSMWFWGRNVHFFGDAAWGAPPGGTYWNKYKQGPASGTQVEFVGVTNWTLPCKFPAPWISDDEYAEGFDYANARCMFPHNPRLDLSRSTPVATRNGYDRQVMFVHPDLLIVRDNVETVCPTIWRMHSYQVDGTRASQNRATLASPQKVIGQLAILYPDGARLQATDKDDLNEKSRGQRFGRAAREVIRRRGRRGIRAAYDTRSVVLKWDMPRNTSATWAFGVHDEGERPPVFERLDNEGRVTRAKLADGREIIVLLNIEPFQYAGEGIEFDGTVGLVIRQNGKTTTHAVRARSLKAK